MEPKLMISPRGRAKSSVRKKSFSVVIMPSSRLRVTGINMGTLLSKPGRAEGAAPSAQAPRASYFSITDSCTP